MKKLALYLVPVVIIAGCKTTTTTVPEVAAPPAKKPGTKPAAVSPVTSKVAKTAKAAPAKPKTKPKAERKPLKHAAVGANIKASSTHTGEIGEGPAKNLIDGDLATRWSSQYSEPQQITIDLGKPRTLKRLRLHWEAAAATKYSVSVSPDGKDWVAVEERTAKGIGPRKDEIKVKDLSVQSIRLDLQNRVNTNWGFSLYEVEAVTD